METLTKEGCNATIKPGPAKTLSRSLAKSLEYRAEYFANKSSKRWCKFEERFEKVFGRSPTKPEDFVWNVLDFARCSITVPSARELLNVKEIVEQNFSVVRVKNGYNSNIDAKGSGYRDMKLLVEVEFENLELKNIPKVEVKTRMICEIQLVCEH